MSDDAITTKDILALLSDEAKARRFAEIQNEISKLDDARMALETQQKINESILADAQAERQKTQDMLSSHADDVKAFEDEKARVSELNGSLSAEKQRFSEVRDQVEGQHAAKEAALRWREDAQMAFEASLRAREAAIGGREDSARVMAEHAAGIIADAKAFVAKYE